MAKFCTKCGAPLQEGQMCACQQAAQQQVYSQQAAQEAHTQQEAPPPPVYAPPAAPAAPGAVSLYFKRFWSLVVGLAKAPATVAQKYVNACDFRLAFGLIGAQALATALFLLSLAGKINKLISVGGSLTEGAKLPLFTIFIVSAAVTYGLALVLPAILLMFIKIFKGSTDYRYMLCVSGVNSILTTPFILAGLLLSLVMPASVSLSTITNPLSVIAPFTFPLVIALAGNSLGLFTSLKALRGGSDVADDKAVYVMFLTGLVMAAALYIALRIFVPVCLPSLTDSMNGFDNILN